MGSWGNECTDVGYLQLGPEDPQSCGFGCTPAGHRPQPARPTALHLGLRPVWLWSSTARSELRTTS